MKLALFEIKTVDKKHFINIPYRLKDELKSAVASAKWDSKEKCWYVGSRSLKKLKSWIEKNGFDADAYEKEQQERHDVFNKKLENSKQLSGKTYKIKDELKERFNAFFYNKSWYVAKDKFKEAQAFVDEANSNAITKERILAANGDIQKILELLADISENFSDEIYYFNYTVEDVIDEYIRFYHVDEEKVKNAIYDIGENLFYCSQEAEEISAKQYSFDDSFSDLLKILEIPQYFVIKNGMINDYSNVEDDIIDSLVKEKAFFLVDRKEASKYIDEVGGKAPKFCFRSKITNVCYDIRPEPDISSYQNSGRVRIYDAQNIPVLKSENFETVMNYWRNRDRSSVIDRP